MFTSVFSMIVSLNDTCVSFSLSFPPVVTVVVVLVALVLMMILSFALFRLPSGLFVMLLHNHSF